LSRLQFSAVLLAALLLRAAALPLPGTGDVTVWKIWSHHGSGRGVAQMYGVGGSPPERRVLEFAGTQTVVDYPPLALYELGAAGDLYWLWSHRRFPNSDTLIVFVKLPAMAAEAALVWLLFVVVRRRFSLSTARWAAACYLLNPAAILDASALGYLDPQFVLPAIASLVAAAAGLAPVSGALAASAVLTKAQAIFVLPAIALGLWNSGPPAQRFSRLLAAGAAALVIAGVVVEPVVLAGGWPNLVQAVGRLAHHDMLSANACNAWWLAGWATRIQHSVHDMGVWNALTAPARILTISRAMEVGMPNPRVIGALLTIAAAAWALWTARSARDVTLLAATGAFIVHAYATLGAQVHENHLFAAVPLLVLASAGRRALRPVCAAVTAIVALNLNLFYGISEGVGYALPRALTIVDATVVLAVLNCAALVWHAAVFSRECSTEAGGRRSPGPGSLPAPAGHSRSLESCT
jgi:hypothetical protein